MSSNFLIWGYDLRTNARNGNLNLNPRSNRSPLPSTCSLPMKARGGLSQNMKRAVRWRIIDKRNHCSLQAWLVFTRTIVFIWKQNFRSSQWLRRLARFCGATSANEASRESFFVISPQIRVSFSSFEVAVIICRHLFRKQVDCSVRDWGDVRYSLALNLGSSMAETQIAGASMHCFGDRALSDPLSPKMLR